MTPPEPAADPPPGELADGAFADDAERNEAERNEAAWLLARDGDPGAPPPSPQIASDYAEIEDLLGNLGAGAPDDAWQAEVLRAAMPPATRPRWRTTARWVAGGMALAAASVVVVMRMPRAPTAELEVAIVHGAATRGDSRETAVGDRLIVTARPSEAGELRVFRSGGTVVARCPEGPACRAATGGDYTIDLTLDAPVRYQVILAVGLRGAPADATMDAYLRAAHTAHARIVMYQPIDAH